MVKQILPRRQSWRQLGLADKIILIANRVAILYSDNKKENFRLKKQIGIPEHIGGQYHCGIDSK
jgi:hypothetical protein